MSEIVNRLNDFVSYVKLLDGDEKGEAQVFCDRLFQAFGHQGYKEAGAKLEYRIKKNSTKGTSFADLIWKPRLLVEMKKRGEKLFMHYKQAFDYWIHAVPDRPRYVVLCNFDEFWIYDFDKQINQPVDIIKTENIPKRFTSLNFLFPENPSPIFGNDLEAVSREAADKVALLFNHLVERGIKREVAQRFVLQLVVAMFAEDIDLLPAATVYNIVDDCLKKGQSSYDLFGGLYHQMNNPSSAAGGRYRDVPYFNGGLFSVIEPIDLTQEELFLIGDKEGACLQDWSKINPVIFGTLFQQCMDAEARHAYGAHFTSEADILRIVNPTIVRPWQERIDSVSTKKELKQVRNDLLRFKVLDPACGSGNFLYVAYRELVRLEVRLLARLKSEFSFKEFEKEFKTTSLISPRQFFGIDMDPFAVELAKVTLMLTKKLALDEAQELLERDQLELPLGEEEALPLENLDNNVLCMDALFNDWPEADAIIGNPPFQSKNKIQQELGVAYLNRLRGEYPEIDGRADYCVYWLRRSHDELKEGQRAGLVGTNTIRQNYSRFGGLDYILSSGGEITEAVSTMKWSGEAVVHVSIVNWIKGEQSGLKRLYIQEDDNDSSKGWRYEDFSRIGSSLSFEIDVSSAQVISVNASKGGCYQGQTHGHEGFLLSAEEAKKALQDNANNSEVLFPFLIARDLISAKDSLPTRYVIDFHPRNQLDARKYKLLFHRVQGMVLPDRQKAADEEEERNNKAIQQNPNARINRHHRNFLLSWWKLSYPREGMVSHIQNLSRYIVCGRVTKRPIFEFVNSSIRPNDALMVFPFEDDYSFGILQSFFHWVWFVNRCSTLKGDPRYTSNSVFDSFPWPQNPSLAAVKKVAQASIDLRLLRRQLMAQHNMSLRDLYRSVENPGTHPLKKVMMRLDSAVAEAYAIKGKVNLLEFLLKLNSQVVTQELSGGRVVGPGLPPCVNDPCQLISSDCLRMP